MWFSNDTFHQMLLSGWIVDGRAGGLVVGRSHDEGNIYMIQETGDGRFFIPGHLEGGEYILNYDAYEAEQNRIIEINQSTEQASETESLPISSSVRVINTSASPNDKLLWIDIRGQFIINKFSTKKFMLELQEINEKHSSYKACNLDSLIPKEQA